VNELFKLIILMLLTLASSAYAQGTGYVVGRVYLQIDGYQGVSGHIVEPVKLVVAHVKDGQLRKIDTVTDDKGHFVLKDQSLEGAYYPYSIHGTVIDQALPSLVPDPDTTGSIAGRLYQKFSSTHEVIPAIIDCGETVIILNMAGNLSVEYYCGKKYTILDYDRKPPYGKETGDFGYAGFQYFSHSKTDEVLRTAAQLALVDRKLFHRAEPLKIKGDKLRYKNRKKAIKKYREAIEIYPAYEQAYIVLASTLHIDQKDLAIKVLQKGLEYRPDSYGLTLALGKEYLASGKPKEARELFARLVDRTVHAQPRIYLLQAYIKEGRVKQAIQTARAENKAVVYFGAYEALMSTCHFKWAYQMLQATMTTHADGTLDVDLSTLQAMLKDMPTEIRNARYFIRYLKSIQRDSDDANWKGKPYDQYVRRNPAAAAIGRSKSYSR